MLLIIPMAFIILSKLIFLTKTSLFHLGSSICIVTELIIQFSEFCFVGCIHFWLFYTIKMRLHLSTVLLNTYFITFYFLLFCIALYDYQNVNFNMQTAVFSLMKAYVPIFSSKSDFSFPLDLIPRNCYNSLSFITDIVNAIVDEPIFWLFFFTFLLFFISYSIYIIIRFRLEICFSLNINDANEDFLCDCSSLIDPAFKKDDVSETNYFNSKYFKILHIFGLLYITIGVCYCISPIRQRIVNLTSFTSNFNLFSSLIHYEKKLNKNVDFLNISRRYLPKNRYWIDNREEPIYPMVHGDINAFCAYNPNDEKCKIRPKMQSKPDNFLNTSTNMPNVYFLVIESFNPFSYLINNDFLDEHSTLNSSDAKFFVTETPYYNEKILPNLAKYAKEGVVFSGLASHGLPTLSGMHALLTGVPPSQTFMNIIEATDAHVDDFPSHFRDINNYRTFYATSTDFKFEGLHFWLNRRSAEEEAKIRLNCDDSSELFDDPIQLKLMKKMPKLKKCTNEEIENLIQTKNLKSFPKWFDYLVGFFPDENQSELMNVTEEVIKKKDWLADRVLSKEIQLIWKQQKQFLTRKHINKSLLVVTANMETHIPYFGFDNQNEYEQNYRKYSRFSNSYKKQKFIRVNKYMDKHYIGGIIDFLKKEDNNTIVVIVGDHATRDVPFRKKNTKLTNKTELSSDCYGKASGIDSLFITSGAIVYLGDDENVKKKLKLDVLKGKTIKVATDHNDLIYTMMETLSRLQNKPLPPTSRLGRNLFDFSEEIIEILNESNSEGPSKIIQKLNDMDWQSISYLSHQIDYKRGAEFIRTHSTGSKGAHYYEVASFPTCVKKIGSKNMKTGGNDAKRMFNDMVDFLNVNNYLLYHNRVFNYAFRDEKCIQNGYCELPSQINHIKLNDKRLFIVLFGVPFVVSLLCSIIIMFIRKSWLAKYQKIQNKIFKVNL